MVFRKTPSFFDAAKKFVFVPRREGLLRTPDVHPRDALVLMETLRDLPLGAFGACIANSVLWFVPMYILHTICYPWLQSRRIRYDQEHHASLSFSTLFTMDAQLRREWLNSMHVAVGGLGTVVLEKALVELRVVTALPVSTLIDWWLLARQFLVYFVLFDCYYYFLHRFFFHGSWGWKMHKVHHDSHVCAPSTGFSFHWFEGVVTGGIACGLVSLSAWYPSLSGPVCRAESYVDAPCGMAWCATWYAMRHGISSGMASRAAWHQAASRAAWCRVQPVPRALPAVRPAHDPRVPAVRRREHDLRPRGDSNRADVVGPELGQ